ncbi:hypothetical protein SSS_02266 [Sarcoptes scabiei]|nr:hypothetical protein SSS_02266 [Sarcoptes scabiei]
MVKNSRENLFKSKNSRYQHLYPSLTIDASQSSPMISSFLSKTLSSSSDSNRIFIDPHHHDRDVDFNESITTTRSVPIPPISSSIASSSSSSSLLLSNAIEEATIQSSAQHHHHRTETIRPLTKNYFNLNDSAIGLSEKQPLLNENNNNNNNNNNSSDYLNDYDEEMMKEISIQFFRAIKTNTNRQNQTNHVNLIQSSRTIANGKGR